MKAIKKGAGFDDEDNELEIINENGPSKYCKNF